MSTSASLPRGALIVFEGIDRCGKTTQSTKLAEVLRSKGVPVEHWRFPDRTTAVGKIINEYLSSSTELDDGAIHLLFAANRHEKRKAMLKALASGITLILDRYSYSGVAYTAAKGNPMYSSEWCRAPEVGLPAPDLVLHMALTPEQSAARGGFGEERYERADLQRAVMAKWASLADERWSSIDAAQSIEAIQEQVAAAADPVVSRCRAGGAPLGQLWDYATIDLSPWQQTQPSGGAASVEGEVHVAVALAGQAGGKGAPLTGAPIANTQKEQAQ